MPAPAPVAVAFVAELEAEAQATRRLLERVPEDRLGWRPHPKSMTLGQLALHVATIPRSLSGLAALEVFDARDASFDPPQPASAAEIRSGLEEAIGSAAAYLGGLDAAAAEAPWRLTDGGEPVLTMPRGAMLRALLFNHWYHHRGQLSVYLRLLDVPLPVVYGRTADEAPFGN